MKKEILNIEDLRKACMSVQKMKEKPLPSGLSWFSKFMRKMGWHREYEVLIFDKSQFGNFAYLSKEPTPKERRHYS